ncbi:hypothetical protein [Nitrospira moscoviensis]|uniref:Uncharacterized protein n=1 Tax=Nitrospira moscoviensis TaxID=42253 RepID=A0A0K2GDK2_NITMO|nr:hypothetical protein [Nitrospira moscoviensis]ALA58919.1 hypothetical protein NITMOv2_2506 [Nitrospira moscoviensis]
MAIDGAKGCFPARRQACEGLPGRWVSSLALMLLAGCALTQEVSRTPRSAIEQLLLSHAVERALENLAVPLPEGESVRVEVSGLQTDRAHLHLDDQDESFGVIDSPSWDLGFVRDAMAGRLGELGYRVRRRGEEATYLVRVMVHAMGTNQGKTFFGIPAIQSVIIPFALPQLTLYAEQDQLAHVRLHLELFEMSTGRFVRSTPWVTGSTYHNQYTVFFFFTFRTTDLPEAP